MSKTILYFNRKTTNSKGKTLRPPMVSFKPRAMLRFSLILILLYFTPLAYGADFNSRAAGNWNNMATWIKKLTGTASFTGGSTVVTGTGTLFTSELSVGNVIMLQASTGVIRGTVASITSNTQLVLVAAASGTISGAYGKQAVPTFTDGVVTISDAVTVTSNVTIDQVVYTNGSTLTINTGVTLTIADGAGVDFNNTTGLPTLQVNGTLNIVGTLTGFNAVNISSSGTVNVNNTFTENAGNPKLVVAGKLNVYSTLTGTKEVTIDSGGIVNVSGIFDISGGNSFLTVNAGGNINFTGASSMTMSSVSQAVISGTLTMSGTSSLTTSRGNAGFTVKVNSGGLIDMSGGSSISIGGISGARADILSGGTIKLGGESTIEGIGGFRLCNGANLFIGSANGITASGLSGNIQCSSTRTYGGVNDLGTVQATNTADFTYFGIASQVTGDGLPLNLDNLTISNTIGSVTSSNSIAVAGIFQIDNNAVFSPAPTHVISGTGTLKGNGTAEVTRTIATPDFLNQYTIATKTITSLTIDYDSNLPQNINALNYYNLKVSGARGANSITYASTGTIGISGTFSPNATFTTGANIITGSTFVLNGSVMQTIPRFGFNNLTINNPTNVTLGGTISVNGILSFTTGRIITGSHTVISSGSVSGAGQSTGWVVGNLQKYFSTAAGGTFDVGATFYTPVTVSFASVTTPGSLIASVTDASHPNIATSSINTTKAISRYWTLSTPASGAIGFSSAVITLNWNAADNYSPITAASEKVARYSASSWSYPTVSGTPTTTRISASGITSLGDFTVGEMCVPPTASISYTGTPYCSSEGTAIVTRTGAAGGVYSSTAGLIINASTGSITLGTSTAGTYTVTYTVNSSGCTFITTTTITITLQPYATGSYPGSPYCSNGGSAIPTGTANSTGTLSSTIGLSIDPNYGVVNLAASTPGTYAVTYTVPASGGCSVYTTSYPITINPAPAATISYTGGPFCPSTKASVTRTGTAGGTYTATSGLAIDAVTGEIDPSSNLDGNYTITYTIPAASGCAQFTATTTVTISKATWTGVLNNDWSKSENWSCNSVPNDNTNVVIPAGVSRYPTIAAGTTGKVKNLTVNAGGTLTIDGFFEIKGTITNTGTITATSGTIIMKGEVAQVIPAGAFAGNIVYNLTLDSDAGVTLGGQLNLTNLLTIKKGALNTADYLTLKSSATNTARIAKIESSVATPIVGQATVERYIPGRRKYRLITSSVTTSASATLTAGQEAQSIWGNWQNAGVSTSQNIGTSITGGTAADGFDQITANSSLFTYNAVTKKFVAFSSANGKNTKYTPLKAGVGYYMFVYGDRQNSAGSPTPRATVLSTKGTLLMRDQLYNSTTPTPISNVPFNYTLIGNPYASIIDWKQVSMSQVSKTIWGWDANLSNTGGYVTVNTANLITLIAPISSLIKVSQYVQPGQAFFVQTLGTTPSFTIKEDAKLSENVYVNNNVFRTDSINVQPIMAINLLYKNAGNDVLADGTIAAFDATFLNEVSEQDGVKMLPPTEGVALAHGSNLLSIDARRLPVSNDTMHIYLSNITKPQYTLEIFGSNMAVSNTAPYLEDNYLHTVKLLSQVDTNRIVFNVNTDAASFDANRFKIVFRELQTLPVTFTSIKATDKGNNNAQVEWNVAQESGIDKYYVEYSNDGVTFSKKAEVASSGNNAVQTYKWLDVNTASGNNFYRVRAMQADGKNFLSKTEVVKLNVSKSQIKIFPNPVTNQQLNLQLDAVDKGQYTFIVRSAQGQQITKTTLNHSGGSTTLVIPLNKKLSRGIYYLSAVSNSKRYELTFFVE